MAGRTQQHGRRPHARRRQQPGLRQHPGTRQQTGRRWNVGKRQQVVRRQQAGTGYHPWVSQLAVRKSQPGRMWKGGAGAGWKEATDHWWSLCGPHTETIRIGWVAQCTVLLLSAPCEFIKAHTNN